MAASEDGDLRLPPLGIIEEQALSRLSFDFPDLPPPPLLDDKKTPAEDLGLMAGEGDIPGIDTHSQPPIRGEERKKFLQGIRSLQRGDPGTAVAELREFLAAHPDSRLAPYGHYWLAEALLSSGDWRGGRLAFESAPASAGRYAAPSTYAIGWMSYREGAYAEAANSFRQAVEGSLPDDLAAPALLGLAVSLFNAESYGEAAAAFQKFNESCPKPVLREQKTLLRLAVCRWRTRDFNQAASLFGEYADAEPGDPEAAQALFARAWCRVSLGAFAQAASDFTLVARRYPGLPLEEESLYLGGRAAAEAGDGAGALQLLEEVASRFADGKFREGALFHAAAIRFRGGEFDQAAELFRKAGDEYPGSALAGPVRFLAGDSYVARQDYRRASEMYVAASSDARLDLAGEALVKAGWCWYRLAEYENAVTLLRRFLLNYPEAPFRLEGAFWLARSLYQAGNYTLAAYFFQEAASEGDRSVQARYGLGLARYRQQKWPEAAAAFGEYLALAPEAAEAAEVIFLESESLFNAQESQRAKAGYEELLLRFPDTPHRPEALLHLGQASVQVKDCKGALLRLGEYGRLYPEAPGNAEAHYLTAWCQLQLGEADAAAAAFKSFVARFPGDARLGEARLWLGDALYRKGQAKEAAESYGAAAGELRQSHPDLAARAQYQLAICWRKLDDADRFKAAVEEFHRLFPEDPRAPELLYLGGEAEHRSGREAEALAMLRKVVDLYPLSASSEPAGLLLGRILIGEGKFQEAAGELHKTAVRHPAGDAISEILFSFGLALKKQGDCRGASETFQKVIDDHPESPSHPDALFQDAQCGLEGGDQARATLDLERLVQLYPNHASWPQACLQLADIRIAEDKLSQALDLLKKAASHGSEEIAAPSQLRIGWVYNRMGETERSAIEYLKIPYLFPGRVDLEMEAKLAAANVYAGVGRRDEALAVLKPLVGRSETGELADKARRLMETLGVP